MTGNVFDGIKVLDCSSFIAAPAAATVLSDFGAEVIKIEPPSGDPFRNLPLMPGSPISPHNYAWLLEGRNRKSLGLDLSRREGRDILHRLAAQTDIFITNYPRAVRRRLDITYDALSILNGRLIYASFTGFGEKGEEADAPGYDMTAYWARSGLMDIVRSDATASPARAATGMGDHPSAMTFFAAIVTALYRRERTGRGMQVGTSLLANGAWANAYLIQAALCGATFIDRPPRERALNALTNHYQCRDGRWLILTLVNEDRLWPVLAKALGREDLTRDPRFAEKRERHRHAAALIAILDEIFAAKDLSDWRAILSAAKDLTFSVVATTREVAEDRQMIVNDILVPLEGDRMLTVSSPFWVDEIEKARPRHAPAVGEHSDEVLRAAGYDDLTIGRLRESGVVV